MQICEAKQNYIQKYDHFQGLCNIFADKVSEWNKQDCSAQIKDKDKEVMCVYWHNRQKVMYPLS